MWPGRQAVHRISLAIALLAITLLAIASPAQRLDAQTGPSVRGTVTASDNGEPVQGATVLVAGTRLGTITDDAGRYVIRLRSGTDTVVVSRIGFRERRVAVAGRTTLDITLERTASTLSNVVTIGYGTQKRSDITGSVTSVPLERLEDKPNVTVAQALQGSMPGVSVVNTGAGAEPSLNITVRGQRSISASSSPLVVVDGIPYNGPLSEFNPGDVASIDVLKDGSATAIYGARGSNGVILVTTKKGAAGKARVSYSGSIGSMDLVELPRTMTAAEFITFKCERLRVRADQPCTELFTQTENDNITAGIATQWAELGTRAGQQKQHDLSVSGGSEDTKYNLGGSLLDVDGVAKNDRYIRTTFRANVDQKIRSWLTAGTSTQFSRTDRSGLPISFTDAYYQNPLIKPFNADGSILINPWPEQPINGANPLENLFVRDDAVNNRLFTANYAQLTVPRIQGLSFRVNVGADLTNSNNGRYYGRNTGTGLRSNGTASSSNSTRNDWTVEQLARFQRTFGRHAFEATGLYSVQSSSIETRSRDAQGFPNDVLGYRSPLATLNVMNANVTESKLVSQMGRVNYGFDERYLVTLTTRRDGYSGFGANNKYGVFPSYALAWNLSNESFFPFKESVDALKLRFSSAENGNQAINPYQTLSQLNDKSYLNGDATAAGYIPSTLGNPNLKWETTKSTNIGFDLSMWKGRVSWTFDRYEADTRDLLLSRAVSSVQGITRITQNIGQTANWGWESQLSTINLDRGGVRWSTDLNVSVNRNQIVDLYGDGRNDLGNGWFIGMPVDVNFGYKFDGIWQVADTARIKTSAQPTAKPGDVRITDVNGDGKIDPTDRTIIGSLQPKYAGGLTNTVKWKGFTVSAFLQTVQGVTRQNVLRSTGQVNSNVSRNALFMEYWSAANPINTYPANSNTSNPLGVDFYEDASFVRLKDASVSYDLPKGAFSRLGFSTARVYVNARNLWTKSKWTGMDPELSSQRAVPLERSFTAGVTLRY